MRGKLKPKIDTLPLSLASRDAEIEQEKNLFLDLALQIVEGNPYPRMLYTSGDARKCLSSRAFDALGVVLRSAAYEAEKEAKRKLSLSDSDEVEESCEKEAGKLKKMASSSSDVKKAKAKQSAIGSRVSTSTISCPRPRPPLVIALMCSDLYAEKFGVYEEYDSGVDSGPYVPMSPNSSGEWDPDKHPFLLIRKRRPETSETEEEEEEDSPSH